jgi:hypothetical protein
MPRNIRQPGDLRLVHGQVDNSPGSGTGGVLGGRQDISRELYDPAGHVERETLRENDARMIFANSVAEKLEGGKAAILRTDSREALQKSALSLGLRAFDANLIIAIVQDAARRGEIIATANAAFSLEARKRIEGTLQLMPGAQRWSEDAKGLAIIAVVLGVMLLFGLVVLIGP